jgi:hypothetical protein
MWGKCIKNSDFRSGPDQYIGSYLARKDELFDMAKL